MRSIAESGISLEITKLIPDYIALGGFILSVFVAGVAVGKFVEKVERLAREKEDEEHEAHKNDRR